MTPHEDLQVLVGRCRRLGQTVVKIVGDATPLLFLGGQESTYEVVHLAFASSNLLIEPGARQLGRASSLQVSWLLNHHEHPIAYLPRLRIRRSSRVRVLPSAPPGPSQASLSRGIFCVRGAGS